MRGKRKPKTCEGINSNVLFISALTYQKYRKKLVHLDEIEQRCSRVSHSGTAGPSVRCINLFILSKGWLIWLSCSWRGALTPAGLSGPVFWQLNGPLAPEVWWCCNLFTHTHFQWHVHWWRRILPGPRKWPFNPDQCIHLHLWVHLTETEHFLCQLTALEFKAEKFSLEWH